MTIFNNYPLIASLSTFFFTQIIKVPIAMLMGRDAPAKLIISTGGMPSSHSAGVSSLITALIIQFGIASPLVAMAWVFGILVMYDAMHVRRQSGETTLILRQILTELQQTALDDGWKSKQRLLDLDKQLRPINLGHKPSEVLVGGIVGVIIALLFKRVFY